MGRCGGLGRVWIGALLLAGCPGDSDDGAGATCQEVADHIVEICGEGIGSLEAASARYDCETFGWPGRTKSCVLSTRVCDEDDLGRCDFGNRIWVCAEGNEECPPGLSCNLARGECTQCDADAECGQGELCLDRWCVPDTPGNATWQMIFEP